MLRSDLLRKIMPLQRLCIRNKSEPAINVEELERETATTLDVIDEDAKVRDEEIERKRNKSRLKAKDRNMLLDTIPEREPTAWYQATLKYSRKMYGRYGEASGFDPAHCWPTKRELADKMEYERIAHPFTIPQMVEATQKERKEKQTRDQERQEQILQKMQKLEQWKKDLKNKIAKKESDAFAAKERKERLVEEVRRHFGYSVDPKDDKFKEMLEKKEKEQKKVMKEARKKAKEERLIASLISKKSEGTEAQSESNIQTADKKR